MREENKKLTWSREAIEALRIMNDTRENLFLTGRAGTGKSTLLTEFRKNTKKKIAVLAPTGVAAVNVSGQTIHSFCGFKPDVTLKKVKRLGESNKRVKVLQKLDAIIIDEVSMCRADLLDCFEKFLRLNIKRSDDDRNDEPFGGLQIIFIGDLYQLPPVVVSGELKAFQTLYDSPYFYSAECFRTDSFNFIELEKVYRQVDHRFVKILNTIRNNSVSDVELEELNVRYSIKNKSTEFVVCLTSTNAKAGEININSLNELKEKEYTFDASVSGKFERSNMPTDETLRLKVGAQVMLLNNDMGERWVNGTMAVVDSISYESIFVKLETGEVYELEQNSWEVFEYYVEGNTLKTKNIGTFMQYPLKLAWAITIHKSQGKTFDQVIIDIGSGTFAHGQLYVALSRCRTLEGITLRQPLEKRHVIMDSRVVKFVTSLHYAKSEKRLPIQKRVDIIKKAIADKSKVRIVYLKNNDERSERIIEPKMIGEMEYKGKKYLGIEAFCHTRQGVRVFRVDRMIEMVIV